ncbi:hypothetical protein MLD38_013228 [Melastoma candidum]|uniref:Uncharacterized protein n=1 Tax=Melastoma candidum TaxID=119954 RepID=A0ACB9R8X7_9MYRT|nr:hypothetical protein MLD38_013228 [Melastoma candidum]
MLRKEVLIRLIQCCENAKSVSQLHAHLLKSSLLHDDRYVARLCRGYGECVSLDDARKLFDEIPDRNARLWNTLLKGYCYENRHEEALRLFGQMVCGGEEKPDGFTIPKALKACAELRLWDYGRMIHGFVRRNEGFEGNQFVGSGLVEFYMKTGDSCSARNVFRDFHDPDVVMWTCMITGYVQNGRPDEALGIFAEMISVQGLVPDRATFVSVASACSQLFDLKLGRSVHGYAVRKGYDNSLSLMNSLLNLYAKAGFLRNGLNLFRTMPARDVISWSSIIACCAQYGHPDEALSLYNEMVQRGFDPNVVTVISALQACAAGGYLEQGKTIHELVWRKFSDQNVSVSTALIDMYMKNKSPKEAMDVFQRIPDKDVVAWVALLTGFTDNKMASESLGIFCEMLASGIQPDAVAMVKILVACSELGVLKQATCLHGFLIRSGFLSNPYVGASLIELYSKCGNLDFSSKVFHEVCKKDVVVWSSMIAGYGMHGLGREAHDTFQQMILDPSVKPNDVTFLSVLSACSHSGLIDEGLKVFQLMHQYRLRPDSKHYAVVVDLLGRMGDLGRALAVIQGIQTETPLGSDVWAALLGASRVHDNIEVGEFAAENLLHQNQDHAGYYILLSNIYAAYGRWEDMANLRSTIKLRKLNKMTGQSLVEVAR